MTLETEYRNNEEINDHTANLRLLASWFGNATQRKIAKMITDRIKRQNGVSSGDWLLNLAHNEIHRKLIHNLDFSQ